SSMYHDLTEGRNLGQLHIVLDPSFFTDLETFRRNISQTMRDLNGIKPAPGFEQVLYPGQNYDRIEQENEANGIEIVDEIYDYLTSDVIHHHKYDHKDPFAT
ncbi:MAG: Ldh family oxidoreductase, partial [Paenibacillus sp.]|nr:Ldh family oxidoreductase [Paenibacillus sp.]